MRQSWDRLEGIGRWAGSCLALGSESPVSIRSAKIRNAWRMKLEIHKP